MPRDQFSFTGSFPPSILTLPRGLGRINERGQDMPWGRSKPAIAGTGSDPERCGRKRTMNWNYFLSRTVVLPGCSDGGMRGRGPRYDTRTDVAFFLRPNWQTANDFWFLPPRDHQTHANTPMAEVHPPTDHAPAVVAHDDGRF